MAAVGDFAITAMAVPENDRSDLRSGACNGTKNTVTVIQVPHGRLTKIHTQYSEVPWCQHDPKPHGKFEVTGCLHSAAPHIEKESRFHGIRCDCRYTTGRPLLSRRSLLTIRGDTVATMTILLNMPTDQSPDPKGGSK
jgi:hypothetical protein